MCACMCMCVGEGSSNNKDTGVKDSGEDLKKKISVMKPESRKFNIRKLTNCYLLHVS